MEELKDTTFVKQVESLSEAMKFMSTGSSEQLRSPQLQG